MKAGGGQESWGEVGCYCVCVTVESWLHLHAINNAQSNAHKKIFNQKVLIILFGHL
jgi:hypothetical protein